MIFPEILRQFHFLEDTTKIVLSSYINDIRSLLLIIVS